MKNNQVKASICIPSYNHSYFVEEAIKSALNQNFDSFEVVVSDDWSTDNTPEVLDKINDERLIKITPPKHLGMGQNWNFCISKARGEYIILLSSDDKISPDFLKEQSAILDGHPEVSYVFCASSSLDENNKTTGIRRSLFPSKKISKEDAYLWCLDGPKNTLASALFRKELYDKVGGFNDRYLICLDWDFWMKLITCGDVYYNDHILAHYRRTKINPKGYFDQQREILEVFEDYAKNCPNYLKAKIAKEYPKFKKRLSRRAIAIPTEIRNSHPKETDDMISFVKGYCNSKEIRLEIFLNKFSFYRKIISLFIKIRESFKMIIKRIIWKLN